MDRFVEELERRTDQQAVSDAVEALKRTGVLDEFGRAKEQICTGGFFYVKGER